jgi:Methane oxygenase PmoA
MNSQCCSGLVLAFLTTLAARGGEITVNDPDGALGATRSPVAATAKLSQSQRRAAVEGRLQLRELRPAAASVEPVVPVQLFPTGETSPAARICWLMPSGPKGKRSFRLEEARQAIHPRVIAKQDTASGQFDLADDGKLVLRYNYAAIEPGDIFKQVAPANRIYARARSDYIHPLYGLDGEELTRDWSIDHPHHRGIYWAWPEVDWRGQRGDLHALQHVFAKPIGKCTAASGPVFAQLEAENVWQWENGESLVHERAVIRAYRATENGRVVDLEFQFAAMHDTVLLARRETDKYGGLNLRLASVKDQEIIFHTDPTNTASRLAWAELNGRFGDAPRSSGLVVLQHRGNPDYPGDWVKFPELNWFQPTFPASGTRYPLKPGEPLVLRFRLWLHRGSKASEENCAAHGRAYHAPLAPNYLPVR